MSTPQRFALAPWGVLPWAIGLLAATAWFTVLQRILHVRRELHAYAAGVAARLSRVTDELVARYAADPASCLRAAADA